MDPTLEQMAASFSRPLVLLPLERAGRVARRRCDDGSQREAMPNRSDQGEDDLPTISDDARHNEGVVAKARG